MDSSNSMARSLVALLVATEVFASAVACGSSSDTPAPEAGPGDVPDAGDVEPTPDPGSTLEAGPDSAPPDDGTTKATVVAKASDGTPAPGVHVVVSHPGGALALHTKTSAKGTVTVRVPKGGAVSTFSTDTTVSPSNQVSLSRWVQTVTSPPNGAVLERGAAATTTKVVLPPPPNDPMTLHFAAVAAGDLPSGTTKLDVSLPCGGFTTGTVYATDYSYEGCTGQSTYDVVVYAQNAKGENVGYAFLLDQPFTPGGSATHTLKPTKTSFVTTQTTFPSIPAGSTVADITMTGTKGSRTRVYVSPPGSSVTATLSLPVEFASTLNLVEYVYTESRTFTHRRLYTAPVTPPASTAVNLGRVADIRTIAPLDLAVIDRPSASWSLEPTGSRDGCVRLNAVWKRGLSETNRWVVDQVAAEVGEAKFPELPPELVDFAPKVGDTIPGPSVMHSDVTGKTGLDACNVSGADESTVWSASSK